MKKIKIKRYGKWKNWKRPSFHFYLVLSIVLITLITAGASSIIANLIADFLKQTVEIPTIVLIVGFSVIIGFILSVLISMLLLKPIAKLQYAMNEVSEGNLNIKVDETNSIEEIENINHSFNIMVKELNSTQAMQKDFVSNVSHEFKTPLSAIEGYATLLQDKTLTEEEKEEYINEILFTTKEMSELVANILLLSKIENQAIDCKKDIFSLDEQIRKIVVLLEPKWEEKNIEFDVELEQINILNNESLLFNVWRNLIENAIKFSPNGGKINLILKRELNKIIFCVKDQGNGVAEEEKELIFNKFYQSDTSHKQEGNGLGLSLVKKIVTTLGGSVTVENLSPKGCAFTVAIPD